MLRRAVLALSLACVLVAPASATWSIVVVDRRTGEVAIGSATCNARANLLNGLPAIVVGRGGGVVQASGNSRDLVPMAEGLRLGLPPAEILELVQAAEPSVRQLQTAVVALYDGAPVTFTGTAVGRAKHGVTGEVGDLAYAIQGNVITGDAVVTAAEAALLGAGGDLGQKLLAAMQAARDMGGDGRCSCSLSRPDSCGAPPADFDKSAHCGFLVLARMGDPDAPCLTGGDCADRAYHLRLNVRGQDAAENDPDPVDQLSERYAEWRAERRGRPDGLLSRVAAVDSLPADGVSKRQVTVQLVDIDGVALDHGGATVRVATVGGARAHVLVGPVLDLGDGRYRFSLGATTHVGTDRLVITAHDDLVRATLYPYLVVRSEPPAALHAGLDRISASRGGRVPLALSLPELPGAAYVVLASASGTRPGQRLPGGALLPLNRDPWLSLSLRRAGDPEHLPRTIGILDGAGRAEAAFVAAPAELGALIGIRMTWAAVAVAGGTLGTTNAVAFEVVP